jgi:hypothetical protein
LYVFLFYVTDRSFGRVRVIGYFEYYHRAYQMKYVVFYHQEL